MSHRASENSPAAARRRRSAICHLMPYAGCQLPAAAAAAAAAAADGRDLAPLDGDPDTDEFICVWNNEP